MLPSLPTPSPAFPPITNPGMRNNAIFSDVFRHPPLVCFFDNSRNQMREINHLRWITRGSPFFIMNYAFLIGPPVRIYPEIGRFTLK